MILGEQTGRNAHAPPELSIHLLTGPAWRGLAGAIDGRVPVDASQHRLYKGSAKIGTVLAVNFHLQGVRVLTPWPVQTNLGMVILLSGLPMQVPSSLV